MAHRELTNRRPGRTPRRRFPKLRWPRAYPNGPIQGVSTGNSFSVLDGLVDEEFSEFAASKSVEAPMNANLARKVPRLLILDQSVKKLVLSPECINELEVLYPPCRMSSVRQAKKAHAMSYGGWYATDEGPAKIVYGSYADGALQA